MLEVKNLKKQYANFELMCSFEVQADQVVGLVGRNGAGKSTTFKAILNLIQPDSGEVRLFDQPVAKLDQTAKKRIGATFPNSFFSEELTILEIRKIMASAFDSQFDSVLFDTFCQDLELPPAKKIKNFSTGMLAKLKLITVLTHQADFLLLDEPTAGLDVVVRQEILGILQDYLDQKADRSVLISSHISSDLEQLCDKIILIDQGKILLIEETDRLLNDYGVLKVSETDYQNLEKEPLIAVRKRAYGYDCLTDERQFYQENYPQLAVEKVSIDDVLILLTEEEVR